MGRLHAGMNFTTPNTTIRSFSDKSKDRFTPIPVNVDWLTSFRPTTPLLTVSHWIRQQTWQKYRISSGLKGIALIDPRNFTVELTKTGF